VLPDCYRNFCYIVAATVDTFTMRCGALTLAIPERREGAARGRKARSRVRHHLAALLVLTSVAAPAASASPLRVGVGADVGVPDGASVALSMSPLLSVRAHVGIANNLVSTGLRGGLTWTPFSSWVAPVLALTYGRFPEGDANPVVRRATHDPQLASPLLEHFGYDFASARLGLEFGHTWATFYLHAGASRVTAVAHGLESELASTQSARSASATVTVPADPKVTMWSVSASAGIIVYLSH
jgi:hypothetical protein